VAAANNDGVWNESGAAIEFTIPPAFYQTRWFYSLCVLALVGLLTLIYKVRMRQVAAQVRGRLEARLAERERIARDLHDTLLQGMQGLIWRFQAATDRIPSDAPARQLMEQSLDRADQLLGESRDRVKDLRPAASAVVDLAQALATEGEQFAKLYSVKFEVTVLGTRRDLHPIVREEGILVSREALSNAFRHAHASSIEVEVTYGDMALHIRIRDDGQGVSGAVLAGGRPGHFGLIGMRERAKRLGAHLDVWSKPGAGTEVELRIPAGVAYRQLHTQSRGIRSWLTAFNSSAQEH
jgi:signal transduction histidine kinase